MTCRHCSNPRLYGREVCPFCLCGYDVSSYGPGESFGLDLAGTAVAIFGLALLTALTLMFCFAYANLGGS